MTDWATLFDESGPAQGATDEEIASFVASVGGPLSPAEIEQIRLQDNPFPVDHPLHDAYEPPDPASWSLPTRPLPESYLSLLRWSNGGWARSGEREMAFFPAGDPTSGVRAMALDYEIPAYLPGALPIAFDGSGTFYLLDMRADPDEGEYPVVGAHAASLGWGPEQQVLLGFTLEQACAGRVRVEDLR
jgi:hypothetical protein